MKKIILLLLLVKHISGVCSTFSIPRGVRNNNPGNIVYSKYNQWEGQIGKESNGGFVVFKSPLYGIRAMVVLIGVYKKQGIVTVHSLISKYSPSKENNTKAYIKYICKKLKIKPNQHLKYDKNNLKKLIKAIIYYENGVQPYSDRQVEKGVLMGLKGDQ